MLVEEAGKEERFEDFLDKTDKLPGAQEVLSSLQLRGGLPEQGRGARLGSQRVPHGVYRVVVSPDTLTDQISVLAAYLTTELALLHTLAFENDLQTGEMQIHSTACLLVRAFSDSVFGAISVIV